MRHFGGGRIRYSGLCYDLDLEKRAKWLVSGQPGTTGRISRVMRSDMYAGRRTDDAPRRSISHTQHCRTASLYEQR
eukprot:6189824-Pleurochrysis_carterae.AAC.1